jgi:hypothetical protein
MNKPLTNMCVYKVKVGKEREFEALLAKHYPTLKKLGLATDDKPIMHKGKDRKAPNLLYFELFTWTDEQGPHRAHEIPELMQLWEPMGALCDDMWFPAVERFELGV